MANLNTRTSIFTYMHSTEENTAMKKRRTEAIKTGKKAQQEVRKLIQILSKLCVHGKRGALAYVCMPGLN